MSLLSSHNVSDQPIQIAFHATAHGYLHQTRDEPCEDYSGSTTMDKLGSCIVAVADGHGDETCVRAALGARMAVEAAIGCASVLICSLDKPYGRGDVTVGDELLLAPAGGAVLRQLCDSIVAKWSVRVNAHFRDNPLMDEERKRLGECVGMWLDDHPEHLYGTTLACALHVPGAFLLIQQGDGSCILLHENGEVSSPVPEDEACYDHMTTSLCDDDASERIRRAVISDEGISGCFVLSDGVNNSFDDSDELAVFLNDVCRFVGKGGDDSYKISSLLKRRLGNLSRDGSGDDASLGVIALTIPTKTRREGRHHMVYAAL